MELNNGSCQKPVDLYLRPRKRPHYPFFFNHTQTKELVPMMIASLKRKPGMWLGGKALVTGNFIIMKTTGVSSVHTVTVNK